MNPIRAKWKSSMTDRERFNNQMHHKPVDRCFNMEFGYWDENYRLWDIFLDNGITCEEDANRFFGFDRFETVSFNCWMNPPIEERVIEERENTLVLINADGLTAEVPKDRHDTIPHFIGATVVTPDDWEKCKSERFRVDDETRYLSPEKVLSEHPNDRDYPLGIYCGSMIGKIRDMLTFEGLAYACYDYPDMVEDMVETCCQIVEKGLDRLLGKVDFDFASGWEDICFKNGPIVSVPFFRDVVMPRYKRISKKLHTARIDIWFTDCDGDVRPILPYLLEGGINCLFPFEVNGCSHPKELLEQYGGRLSIMGGFDKLQMGAGRGAIDRYFDSIEPLVGLGGYIPFCDHRCPPNITPEDYLYYLDQKEKRFGMK